MSDASDRAIAPTTPNSTVTDDGQTRQITLADLPPQHQRFVAAYLATLNQTRAYLQVYPDSSYDAARADASRLLSSANVRAVVDAALRERAAGWDEIIARQAEIARADIGDILDVVDEPVRDAQGNPRTDRDGQPITRQVVVIREDALQRYGHLIHAISPARDGGLRLELHSAQQAQEWLGRLAEAVRGREGIAREAQSWLDFLRGADITITRRADQSPAPLAEGETIDVDPTAASADS